MVYDAVKNNKKKNEWYRIFHDRCLVLVFALYCIAFVYFVVSLYLTFSQELLLVFSIISDKCSHPYKDVIGLFIFLFVFSIKLLLVISTSHSLPSLPTLPCLLSAASTHCYPSSYLLYYTSLHFSSLLFTSLHFSSVSSHLQFLVYNHYLHKLSQ